MKHTYTVVVILIVLAFKVEGQRNCNVYKWSGDSCRYQACTYLESAPAWFQLRREYHEIYDTVKLICPEYSDSYRAQSTAYLKTGDFITWKKLIDKAVELDPHAHLFYRGWCRFQFFRDYQGAVDDIIALEKLKEGNIGFSQNGTYHMIVAKSLCLKKLGRLEEAISTLATHVSGDSFNLGLYDYLHLGVMFLENKQFQKALAAFEQQEVQYDLAENAYYKALTYKAMGDLSFYRQTLKRAQDLYVRDQFMFDNYVHQIDKVFLKDIEEELEKGL